jgi:ketosteroid isomerase-like protein
VPRYDLDVPDSNLEIVRRAVQAIIEGNWRDALADLDTGVELDQSRPSGVYRGRSGVQEAIERWSEVWVERRVQAEEFIDAGDQIVVVTHEYAKSPRTGVALNRRIAEVWTLDGGKVVAIRTYPGRDAALEAVGVAGKPG